MKLQAVVVIYKMEIGASKTIAGLCSSGVQAGLEISLLIYDNSPFPQAREHQIANLFPITYIHDPQNGGLAPAYNRALDMAENDGAEWLLLLDQDSALNPHYFATLVRALSEYGTDSSIVAVVPHIVLRERQVAPTWFSIGIHRKMKTSWHGIAAKPITTINSASVVRASFLRSLGGFPRQHRLDYADYWFYREVYRHAKRVMVLDCRIDHEMSAANRDTFPPVMRYRDVPYHEGIFYRSSGSRLIVFVFWSRLMLRVVKHYFVFKDKGYSLATLSYIRRELLGKSE
jgi:GT2 family glycosyltransferase